MYFSPWQCITFNHKDLKVKAKYLTKEITKSFIEIDRKRDVYK